jgi:antitoxin ParD1/3/4
MTKKGDEMLGPRKNLDRLALRKVILEGASSEPSGVADAAYFEGLRDQVRAGKSERDEEEAPSAS